MFFHGLKPISLHLQGVRRRRPAVFRAESSKKVPVKPELPKRDVLPEEIDQAWNEEYLKLLGRNSMIFAWISHDFR